MALQLNIDYKQFKREFLKEQKRIKQFSEELIRETVQDGYALVVDQSPKATGRYQASHVFGKNTRAN
ncbi:MAG: hypothetical protein R3254_12150, partial [Thiomicrorhabdus sp.]|nr:hypothetical protein [Thiomicrorhabdus sp.]